MGNGAINIRGVDKGLIFALKVAAAQKGLTLRDYVLSILRAAVDSRSLTQKAGQ